MGADLVAGSLIKNLGGTLAPCGGYVAGNRVLVERATVHLSAPGVDGGATFSQYKNLFQVRFYGHFTSYSSTSEFLCSSSSC